MAAPSEVATARGPSSTLPNPNPNPDSNPSPNPNPNPNQVRGPWKLVVINDLLDRCRPSAGCSCRNPSPNPNLNLNPNPSPSLQP